MTLQAFFSAHRKVALGFSGGVDSAYLLWAAVTAGAEVRPYFVKTPFQPEFELEDAQQLGRELGVEIRVIPLDLPDQVLANPENRCYYCKKVLMTAVKKQARQDGFLTLLDGTNASDVPEQRPGMQALEELEVLSPLRLCGLTKEEIRKKSREAGLFTWNKPSYACLATRIPTGTKINEDLLARIEAAEKALMELGFSDLRVRIFHDAARVQVRERDMERLLAQRKAILSALKQYFNVVMLDLEGRP